MFTLNWCKLAYMKQGDRIRSERKRLGLTQVDLARRIGIAREAVSQWEKKDYTAIKHDNLVKLCKALGNINPKWLLHGEGDKYGEVKEDDGLYQSWNKHLDQIKSMLDQGKLTNQDIEFLLTSAKYIATRTANDPTPAFDSGNPPLPGPAGQRAIRKKTQGRSKRHG